MKQYPPLTAAIPLDGYRLKLTFGSDETRVFDFRPNLNHKYYHPLADEILFKSVTVTDGEIVWATGQDFCPHTLYDQSTPVVT